MKAAIPKSKRPLPKSKRIGLRSKPKGKSEWARLPFVGKDHGPQSCWDVPMSGGYWGGIQVGEVMARVYVKYVRSDKRFDDTDSLLTAVLAGMDKKQPSTKEESQSLHAQRLGFMRELGVWIKAAAVSLGSSFDTIPERSLVQQANESLTQTDAALMAAIDAESAK